MNPPAPVPTIEEQWARSQGEIHISRPGTDAGPLVGSRHIDTVHIDEYLGHVGNVGDLYSKQLKHTLRPPSGEAVYGSDTMALKPPESGWFWGGTEKDEADLKLYAKEGRESSTPLTPYDMHDSGDDGHGRDGVQISVARRHSAGSEEGDEGDEDDGREGHEDPRSSTERTSPAPPAAPETAAATARYGEREGGAKDRELFFWGPMAYLAESEVGGSSSKGEGVGGADGSTVLGLATGETGFETGTVTSPGKRTSPGKGGPVPNPGLGLGPGSPSGSVSVGTPSSTKGGARAGSRVMDGVSEMVALDGMLAPSPAASWISFLPDPAGGPIPQMEKHQASFSEMLEVMPGAQEAYARTQRWPLNRNAVVQRRQDMGQNVDGLDDSMASINSEPAFLASMKAPGGGRAPGPSDMSRHYTAAAKRLQYVTKLTDYDYRVDPLSDPKSVRRFHYVWRELQTAISQAEQAEVMARASYDAFQRQWAQRRTDAAAHTVEALQAAVRTHRRLDAQYHKLKEAFLRRQAASNLQSTKIKSSNEMDELKESAELELGQLGVDLETAQAGEAALLLDFKEKQTTAIRTVRHWRPIHARLLGKARVDCRRMEYLAKTTAVRTLQHCCLFYFNLRPTGLGDSQKIGRCHRPAGPYRPPSEGHKW